MGDHELIKHTAAIHVSNTITLIQRKVSNVLLKNAWHELEQKDTHRIRISDLAEAIGMDSSGNMGLLKDALRTLNRTQLEWNIFGADFKNEWGVSTVLAGARFRKNGICEYSYSPQLRELLSNPNIYARLNLIVQRGFSSKHAIALWEFLTAELCVSNEKEIFTKWLDIPEYRKLLGISEDQYTAFKDLNKYLIKQPVKELNDVSDVFARVEYKREKRRVVAIRFKVEKKNSYQMQLFPPKERPEVIDISTPETITPIIQKLVDRGVTTKVAEQLVIEHGAERVNYQVEHYDYLQEVEKKDIKGGGWFVDALKNDYKPPKGFKTKADRVIEEKRRKLLTEAERGLEQKKYDRALELARELLKIDESSTRAKEIIKKAKEGLGEAEIARKVQEYKENLNPRKLKELEEKAVRQIEGESKFVRDIFKEKGKKWPQFEFYLNQVIKKELGLG